MTNISAILYLKKDRDRPLRQRHPWIFSGAVQRLEGQANAGDLVHIVAADDTWLACAYYNPHSQIQARVLSWDLEESIDEAFWERRLARAIAGRTALQLAPQTNALRLVNAESDDLPGLIVDQYGDFLVLQSQTAGIERWKQMLVDLLAARVGPAGILERSDLSIRKKEGLSPVSGLLWGQPPPDLLTVHENGHPFQVDLRHGHKTGLYLDQRNNRALVCQPRFVAGKRLLNVFSYTGGFAVYAAAAGARAITNLDSSVDVLRLAEANVQLTAPQRPDDEYIAGDAFQVLRHYRDTGEQFDVIILDPPKFAHTQRDVERACRGYKDLNWLALRLLTPGGLLATFSCSGLVSADLFQKVLFGAAVDAGRAAQILYPLGQAPDHPIALTFPESAYLKGFLCRVW